MEGATSDNFVEWFQIAHEIQDLDLKKIYDY